MTFSVNLRPVKLFIYISAAILLLSTFYVLIDGNTANANVPGWKAGNIMDVGVMSKSSTMDPVEIQEFLESKVEVCDTHGQQNSEMNNAGVPDYNGNGSIQRWEWGKKKYNQTVFKCLKDYIQGGKTAARIIYEKSKKHQINPQVMIVLLQKEQGLVNDTWPTKIQYRSATGYGCPDTAACDAEYYGFANQVDRAANMFRAILDDNPDWYTPYELGVNYIQYNPNADCGGTNVNILNRATQALYNYTPYQPNPGALAAGWGTATCGAYGNRNFYLYFRDWFGSTHSPSYDADLYGKSGTFYIKPGLSKRVFIAYRNTGNTTWYDALGMPEGVSPTVLASSSPVYRISPFNAAFDRTDRPKIYYSTVYKSNGSLECGACQDRVLPGQIVKFEFDVTAPMDIGGSRSYEEWFEPIKQPFQDYNGKARLLIKVPNLDITSKSAGVSGLRGAKPGWQLSSFAKIKNTGNVVWYDNVSALPGVESLMLATTSPTGHAGLFSNNYESPGRITSVLEKVYDANGNLAANQHTVRPGETAVFRFVMTVPDNMEPGIYTERFGLRFAGAPRIVTGDDMKIQIKVLNGS